MDFSKHKFRCSSLGHIMGDPKGKSNKVQYDELCATIAESIEKYSAMNKDTKTANALLERIEKAIAKREKLQPIKDIPLLSDTCKTHLCDIYTRVKYERTEDIKSKYLEKGLLMEEDAITLYSMVTRDFHKKNTMEMSNEYIQGTLDFIDEERVIDTKVNWSIFQFTRTAAKPIKPLYHWQLDGYMWLWNRKKGRLAYTLIDTPEHLIRREEKILLYDFVGSEDDYKDACSDLRRNHTFGDIPNEERIRIFDVEYNEERIQKIITRVEECRWFLNNISNLKQIEDEENED